MSRWQAVQNKIISIDEAIRRVNGCQWKNQKVVFTNGCFDILHQGHVVYLAKAADLGDVLILALNTDESVKRQGKGDDRPINNQDSRAIVLGALGFVDYIVFFNNDTPLDLIQNIKPNILVKGADYDANESDETSKKYIVGRKEVLANGGEVKTVELEDGFSTTGLISRMRQF